MSSESRSFTPSRRTVLRSAAIGALLVPAGAAVAACGSSTPSLNRERPTLTHGVATGDISATGALVWARSDRPATMVVETAATESFANARTHRGPQLTPASDGTGRLRLAGLEPGQTVHYRVTMEGEDGARSAPHTGTFTTAPVSAKDIRFLWSGDVAGQGWGINPDIGGMPIFGAMADRHPDFFIHSGDAIYADGPIEATQKQNNGQIYHSVTIPAKSQVAQTVDQFRGNYAYNLTDDNYRRFAASVPQLIQWDDHEVINNWFPGEDLTGQKRKGYTEMSADVLARNARQAWSEWQPIELGSSNRVYRKVSYGPQLDVFILDMRSYKNPNPDAWSRTDAVGLLGEEQTRWLIDGLNRSSATWKVIANDLPLSIVVPDKNTNPPAGPASMEAVGQGDNAAPLGREIVFARILSAIKNVRNVVFLTADVHYTAAISYQPDRAGFKDFAPFWEFVSGPLHAGAFPQSPLDGTFGAKYEFVHAPTEENVSPAEGFQHFGEVTIAKDTAVLTVNLRDAAGRSLYTKSLEPQR
ncbi:alkaline phosphatase D family protein [Gordonia sp. ABSL1-1]|uniref:alkaline phosphatase D family protein n=1 Tax=Gordonia sp. ABSL1-1 TaxID=3053923 RepID=UPI00257314AC|nr:alkaline phosphatase D family protein [Gordonia sp. ABSL1-1]MDL9938846.1 alkaline phosphatase D family protein [Gordonia sp. ABSL1-1]